MPRSTDHPLLKRGLIVSCAAAAILVAAAQSTPSRPSRTAMAPRVELRGASESTNWAGYSATAPGASFVDVKGTWIEPTVDCASSGRSASGFWVGLGGLAGSTALEQVGTGAACPADGSWYPAWYEIVPAPPNPIGIAINPGDTITGEVSADGTTITLRLDDLTTGQSFSTQQTVLHPDLSSAEWIAEAPSSCGPLNPNGCTVMPLSNFGTIAFSAGSATVAGHTGPIADPIWSADVIQLVAATGEPVAQVSDLAPDGSSFDVTWQSTGGALRLLLLGFATTPRQPRAGRAFTATLNVAATNPAALADAQTTCSARIDGIPIRARTRSFAGHTATCVWQLPAKPAGRRIAGTVAVAAHGQTLAQPFSLGIR